MRNRLKQDQGLVLFLVIIYTIIMSILGLAFIVMTGFEQIFVVSEKRRAYAAYMAESGLTYGDAFVRHMYRYPADLGYSATNPTVIANAEVLQMPGDMYNEGRYSVSFTPLFTVAQPGATQSAYNYVLVFSSGEVGTTSLSNVCVRKRMVRKWELKRQNDIPTITASSCTVPVEYFEYPYEKL